jgi:Ubiquitin fusion degradation protein UFD1
LSSTGVLCILTPLDDAIGTFLRSYLPNYCLLRWEAFFCPSRETFGSIVFDPWMEKDDVVAGPFGIVTFLSCNGASNMFPSFLFSLSLSFIMFLEQQTTNPNTQQLGLRPYDVVEVEQVLDNNNGSGNTAAAVPSGSMAKLRPHSSEFGVDIQHNPQAVLETELRHYSSLTLGATIAMQYNQKTYWFDVEELRSSPRGEKVSMIKMQDCNVATDFLLSKDQMLEKQRKMMKMRNRRTLSDSAHIKKDRQKNN